MNAEDIIQRSIDNEPETFRAALIKQAEMHDDYAALTSNPLAKRGAETQRNACLAIYDAVLLRDIEAIMGSTGTLVVALNVAAKLQGLSAAERTAALAAWEEEQINL